MSIVTGRISNIILLLLIVQVFVSVQAQELPPILTYDPDIYRGGNQNWMLEQGDDQFIYAANNEGLLEFNGQDWLLYPSPNETILRSVLPQQDRIYTGCYMEFGYWSRGPNGYLIYRSLSEGAFEKLIPDEQFWNIIAFQEFIIFQSLQQLIFYHPQSEQLKFIQPSAGVFKSFLVSDQLYFSDLNYRFYGLEGGEIVPLAGGAQLDSEVVHCWRSEGEIFVQTATDGCFMLTQEGFLSSQQFDFLQGKRVYCGRNLKNGGHAFGTVTDGLYLTDPNGHLSYHLNQLNGLSNNTVLSIFEDETSNLWLGTDNGINCVNVNSPFREFTDRSGRLGTVYAAAIHEGDLYLGSNQGLFVKKYQSNEPISLVKGTQGQVWSLLLHNGSLLCAHNDGTFLIQQRKAFPIYSQSGTWIIRPVPGKDNLLVQGNYSGLSVLEQKNGRWAFRNAISGFDYSARHLAFQDSAEVYVSHEYRGIYGLRLDPEYRSVKRLKLYDNPTKGQNAGLIRYENKIYYLSKAGLFVLQDYESGFQFAQLMRPLFDTNTYLSGKMSVAGGRLWVFKRDMICHLRPGLLNDSLRQERIPVFHELIDAKSGYENVTALGPDTVLIGTTDGYLLLATNTTPSFQHKLQLNSLHYNGFQLEADTANLNDLSLIPPNGEPLQFHLSVAAYNKYFQPQFQYRLVGQGEEWSDWRPMGILSLAGIGYGEHHFEARSRLGEQHSEHVLSIPLKVQYPWYLRWTGLSFFLFLATSLVYLLHRGYTGYYRRQRAALKAENEQKIALQKQEAALEVSNLKNEQLQRDMDSKSKEIASSMLSLVKKNELLQDIKTRLEQKRPVQRSIDEVIKLIDRSLDDEENWTLFQEAFEHADREFFQRLKDKHPELNPNDLKLCAYLRLNLSTKEIAPLLNISVRSVEVKRYRLRKKLELDRSEGLANYILSV